MFAHTTVTLAATGYEFVVILIVVLGAAAKAIYGAMKKAQTPPAPPRPMTDVSAGDVGGADPGTLSVDELAARRRRELQALARQRQGGGVGRTASGQPANLSMDQLRERARAKAEYERRVAVLRQGGASGPAAAPPPVIRGPVSGDAGPTVDAAEAEARRRRAEQARQQASLEAQRRNLQQERLRQQQAQRQRQMAQRAAPTTSPPRAAAPPRRPAAPAAALGAGSTQVIELSDRDLDAGESVVHRHVPDVVAGVSDVRGSGGVGGGIRGLRLDLKTMRAAVLFSEILAPPVSLRRADSGG